MKFRVKTCQILYNETVIFLKRRLFFIIFLVLYQYTINSGIIYMKLFA